MDEQGLTSDKRADLQEQFTEIQEEAVNAAQEAMETVQTRSRAVWEQEVKPNLDFLNRDAETDRAQTPPVSPEAPGQGTNDDPAHAGGGERSPSRKPTSCSRPSARKPDRHRP